MSRRARGARRVVVVVIHQDSTGCQLAGWLNARTVLSDRLFYTILTAILDNIKRIRRMSSACCLVCCRFCRFGRLLNTHRRPLHRAFATVGRKTGEKLSSNRKCAVCGLRASFQPTNQPTDERTQIITSSKGICVRSFCSEPGQRPCEGRLHVAIPAVGREWAIGHGFSCRHGDFMSS